MLSSLKVWVKDRFQPSPPKPRSKARDRYLLPQEWERLRLILDAQRSNVRVYFYLLLLEGPRMSEGRLMEWEHVDLTTGVWFKPRTKTGRAQTVALSQHACHLLNSLPRISRYVFPGETEFVPWSRSAVFHHWWKIRRLAKLEDLQIRDLRRSFASWMTIYGENLLVVKEVLHHRSVATTQIYARFDHQTVRAALTRHGERLLGGGQSARRSEKMLSHASQIGQSASQADARIPVPNTGAAGA